MNECSIIDSMDIKKNTPKNRKCLGRPMIRLMDNLNEARMGQKWPISMKAIFTMGAAV